MHCNLQALIYIKTPPNKQVLQVATMRQAVDCRIPSQARRQEIQTLKKTFATQQFM